ncbi:unnamed protein product [Clavelina lepadiformis]|uniref:ShKT domain-containing protein n=1 Tax=Clavelina lepadiformis TaxID=159417 RepID=A0ABP0F011_CLALP
MNIWTLLAFAALAPMQQVFGNFLRQILYSRLNGQLYQTGSEKSCSVCQDRSRWCGFSQLLSFCNRTSFLSIVVKTQCPSSCGTCKPCSENMKHEECVSETECQDSSNMCQIFLAPNYCQHEIYGQQVREKCKRSCGVCTICANFLSNTMSISRCTSDCKDRHSSCPHWAKLGYCQNDSEHLDWMQSNCNLSCDVCSRCDGSSTSQHLEFGNLRPSAPHALSPNLRPNVPLTLSPEPDKNTVICDRNPHPGSSIAAQCLNAHNYYRCLHGVQPLRYDKELEISAQAYANGVSTSSFLTHSRAGIDRALDVGENLAYKSDGRLTVNDAVVGWYAKGLDYDYDTSPKGLGTDSFLQIIWRETSSVACAVKQFNSQTFVVAQYRIRAEKERNVFTNIRSPIAEVCEAICRFGVCNGHDGNDSSCSCSGYGSSGSPQCQGHCVIYCPRPEHFRGAWEESCEGSRECSCDVLPSFSRPPRS